MRRPVTIDLTNANLEAFEAYEARVLPLLGKHGGRLEMRVRSGRRLLRDASIVLSACTGLPRSRGSALRLGTMRSKVQRSGSEGRAYVRIVERCELDPPGIAPTTRRTSDHFVVVSLTVWIASMPTALLRVPSETSRARG
jgi:hypothetical protein